MLEGLRKHRLPILCAIFTALYTAGTTISDTPLLRLWELSLCRTYYLEYDATVVSPTGYVEERLCKIEDVQRLLARLRGFDGFFWAISGLLVVPIYTYISSRYDRRKIIFLGLVGYLLSQLYVLTICYFYRQFPIRLVWLASLSTFIGGGPMITISLVQAIVADQIDLAVLSSYLNYTRAVNLVIDILAYSAAAYLMGQNVWLPVPLGIIIYLFCVPLLFVINDKPPTSYTALANEEDGFPEDEENIALETAAAVVIDDKNNGPMPGLDRSSIQTASNSRPHSILETIRHFATSSCAMFWDLVAHNAVTRLTFLIFFLDALATNVQNIASQWASKNLGWTIAQTEYLRAYQSAVGGITLLLLPSISACLRRLGTSAPTANYVVAKYSLFAFSIGSFGFGISWTRTIFIVSVGVFNLGTGYHDAVKSYSSTIVQPDQITQLFIGISAAARLGNLVGGPLWSQFFVLGMSAGKFLSGLPFLIAVPIWLAGLAALSRLRYKYGRG